LYAIKTLKETINKNINSDKYFLDLHFTLEGYLRRLIFIGLRLNDVRYKTAQLAIKKYHEGLNALIDKIWELLKFDEKEINSFGNYSKLKNYVINITSKYRNYRTHGIYDVITDKELFKNLILVDKNFICEIEKFLNEKKHLSCFDQPNKWGPPQKSKNNQI